MSATVSLQGIGASPGVAVGHAFVLDSKRVRTPKVKLKADEVESEALRFKTAVDLSDRQLHELKERLFSESDKSQGQDHALILEAHRMMLHDPMFLVEVTRLIKDEAINAEWAVRRVAKRLKHQFDNLEDEYFRERRADVDFVADRVVRNLLGQAVDEEVQVPTDAVIIAHEISPADAAMLVKTGRIAAFVTDLGGQTSHTAIVARAREVPAVVGAVRASEHVRTGDVVAVDGTRGMVLINPTEQQLALFRETMRRHLAVEATALRTAELRAVTTDGVEVHLNGNIEFPEEIPSLLCAATQ